MFIWAAALLLFSSAAQAQDVSALRRGLVSLLTEDFAGGDAAAREACFALSEYGLANDFVMNQLFFQAALSPEGARQMAGTFDPAAGGWPDIRYDDRNRGVWSPSLHLSRLCALAKVYAAPGHSCYRDPAIASVLEQGFSWWVRHDLQNPNWWWNEIGIPRRIGMFLLLAEETVSPEIRQGALRILGRSCTDARLTGQNLVWEAGNLLMKAVLEEDAEAASRMQQIIQKEVFISEKEGIKADASFYQHGPMLQFGNYGLAFFDSIAFWIRACEGTPWAFSSASKDLIAWFANDGLGWCFYRGTMDPSMRGRHLFPGSGRGKDLAFGIACRNLQAAGIRCSSALRKGMTVGGPLGAKYFPFSDAGIWRSKRYYGSIRMQSLRTLGYEMTNGENIGGFHSADGAILTMTSGTEYEDIFPYWDWRRIPGTTVRDCGGPYKAIDPHPGRNQTAHVGGLAAQGVLAATMDLVRDSLFARKSVFFFDEVVVALGCDIRATGAGEVTTALEQNHLTSSYEVGDHYAYNGRTGYVTLDGAPLLSTTRREHGTWAMLDPALATRRDEGDVFKLWLSHVSRDSYAYAVLPGWSLCATRRAARRAPAEVLSNTSACQAVRHKGVTAVIFHQAGSLAVGSRSVSADGPAIILLRGGKVISRTVLPDPGR